MITSMLSAVPVVRYTICPACAAAGSWFAFVGPAERKVGAGQGIPPLPRRHRSLEIGQRQSPLLAFHAGMHLCVGEQRGKVRLAPPFRPHRQHPPGIGLRGDES